MHRHEIQKTACNRKLQAKSITWVETEHEAQDQGKLPTSCIFGQFETSGFRVVGGSKGAWNSLPIRVKDQYCRLTFWSKTEHILWKVASH